MADPGGRGRRPTRRQCRATPQTRRDVALGSANWFGYLLLIAGPVALLLRTLYPYAVLWVVLAITVAYQAAGFGYGPIFVS